MSIVTIVRETVEAVPISPPLSFGHGPRDYENLRGDGDEHGQDGTGTPSFPMAWLYPFVVNDTIFQSGSMKHEYNVIVDFLQPVDLDASETELETVIEEMFERSKQWELILHDDPRIKRFIGDPRREPLYHLMDTNMCGYACAIRVETEHEAFDYCLPEARQAVCDVPTLTCAELDDLMDSQHACIVGDIDPDTLIDNMNAAQQAAAIAAFCVPINLLATQDLNDQLTQAQRDKLFRIKPLKTGAIVSYDSFDDGSTQLGRGDSFFLLDDNNEFDNKDRFTDSVGGQNYDGTGGSLVDYVIDHQTSLGWKITAEAASNYTTALSNADGKTFATFSDWRLPNMNEGQTLQNAVTRFPYDYSPFDISAGATCWTSNNRGTITSRAMVYSPISLQRFIILKTDATVTSLICRDHY